MALVVRTARSGRRSMPREGVVVDLDADDAALGGEGLRLRLDHLGDEHPAHRAQHRVALHELEVPGELLHAVDLAAALDLDRDGAALGVAAEQVDGADLGAVLAAHEHQPGLELVARGGEQLLEVGLDAVLLQAGVGAEVVGGVGDDLLDRDAERLALRVGDRPLAVALHQAGSARSSS